MIRYRETPCAISRKQLIAREEELEGGRGRSARVEPEEKVEAIDVQASNADNDDEQKDGDDYTTFGEGNNTFSAGLIAGDSSVKPTSEEDVKTNDVIRVKEVNSDLINMSTSGSEVITKNSLPGVESPSVTKL